MNPSLSEALQLFKENVGRAPIRAPDNYPEWDTGGYAAHREELLSLWAQIKPRVRRDTDKVTVIDAKLAEAIACFDRGEREPGHRLMVEIYNVLNLDSLA